MQTSQLEEQLRQLKEAVHQQAQAALKDVGEPGVMAGMVDDFQIQLNTLRQQVHQVTDVERIRLESLSKAVERDLTFLRFKASQAAPKAGDGAAVLRQFSEEAFALARRMVDGLCEPDMALQQAVALRPRLREFASMPERNQPEMQRLLSEAELDLTYVYNAGKGVMSVRLHTYLNARGRAN